VESTRKARFRRPIVVVRVGPTSSRWTPESIPDCVAGVSRRSAWLLLVISAGSYGATSSLHLLPLCSIGTCCLPLQCFVLVAPPAPARPDLAFSCLPPTHQNLPRLNIVRKTPSSENERFPRSCGRVVEVSASPGLERPVRHEARHFQGAFFAAQNMCFRWCVME